MGIVSLSIVRPPLRFHHRAALVLLGLLLAVALLEIALRVGGVLWLEGQARRNRAAQDGSATHRVLCLGESTTAFGKDTSYPRLLEEILNERAGERAFAVVNEGVPRTTTKKILARLPALLEQHRPDVVVTMMGINDREYLLLADQSGSLRWLPELQVEKLGKLLLRHLKDRWSGEEEPTTAPLPRRKRFKEARRRVREDPTDAAAHLDSHNLAAPQRRFETFPWAEAALTEAIAEHPDEVRYRNGLGEIYSFWGRPADAQTVLQRAIDDGIGDDRTRHLLLSSLRLQLTGALYRGELDRAEAISRQALATLPASAEESRADLLGTLGSIARRRGDEAEAARYESEAAKQRTGLIDAATRDNYQALATLLATSDIDLVATQYPMRSLVTLQSLLAGAEVTAWVDNEESFREAVAELGFQKVFTDSFAGDFGHMSKAGRRLLAENVADVLLAEVVPPSKRATAEER